MIKPTRNLKRNINALQAMKCALKQERSIQSYARIQKRIKRVEKRILHATEGVNLSLDEFKQLKLLDNRKKHYKTPRVKKRITPSLLPHYEQWFLIEIQASKFPLRLTECKKNKLLDNNNIINNKRKFIIEIYNKNMASDEKLNNDLIRFKNFINNGYNLISIESYNQDSLIKGLNRIARLTIKNINSIKNPSAHNINLKLMCEQWLSSHPSN